MMNGDGLDEGKLDVMRSKIIELEKENYKNNYYTPGAMVEKIKQIIIEEADKKTIRK